MTLSDFQFKYFTKYTTNEKVFFRGLYYENLLYAMRMLNEKYPIVQLDFDTHIRNERIWKLRIPLSKDGNENIRFLNIELNNLPSLLDFKRQIMNTISNIINEEQVLKEKKKNFSFTCSVKRLFCYFRFVERFTNKDFCESTHTPLWLIFIKRTRIQNIKILIRKTSFDWEVEELPDILVNTRDKLIDFIVDAGVFKENIDIYNNAEFISLMKYLYDINNIEYNLTREDFIRINICLQNLKFERGSSVIIREDNNNSSVELTELEENIVISKLLQLIEVFKWKTDNLIFITKESVVGFIYSDITNRVNLDRKKISYYMDIVIHYTPFCYHFEAENLLSENIKYFFKK